jgi:hypothetical protein
MEWMISRWVLIRDFVGWSLGVRRIPLIRFLNSGEPDFPLLKKGDGRLAAVQKSYKGD